MKRTLQLVAVAVSVWAGAAQAVSTEGHDYSYVGGGALFEFADSARDSDDGLGFHITVGYPLGQNSGESAELSFFDVTRDRNLDGKEDYQRGLTLNYVRDYGLQRFGGDGTPETAYASFKPYWLAGLGAIQEDVRGDDHIHVGINAGGGLLFPIPYGGWAVRAEALAQFQLNDESVADEDTLLDFQVRVGLQVPFNFFVYGDAAVKPVAEDPARVVPVAADSDADGVVDTADTCPDTEAGSLVDAQGCVTQ